MDTKKVGWDWQRFLKTLTYFEIIPGLNLWEDLWSGRLFSDRAASPQPNLQTKMKILIFGANSQLANHLIQSLLAKGLAVTAVVEDLAAAKQVFGDRVNLLPLNNNLEENLSNLTRQEFTSTIYCLSPEKTEQVSSDSHQLLKNLIQLTDRHRKPITNQILFDFTNPDLQLRETWGAVDDVVMGGVSQSQIRLSNNRAIFNGVVSTNNNGGFVSVRTKNFSPPLDLSSFEGIELKVKGDGKRYKFILRSEGKWDGVNYFMSFDTVYDFPISVKIPFAELIPTFRAKSVPDAGAIDSSKIYSMQLMLSKFEYDGQLNQKFEPGSFGLEIENIQAYRTKPIPKIILVGQEQTANYPEVETVKNSGLGYSLISDRTFEAIALSTLDELQIKS